MPTNSRGGVQSHRERLRASGLRPVENWGPDTRRPGFDRECRRQAKIAAMADKADADLQTLQDALLADLGRD